MMTLLGLLAGIVLGYMLIGCWWIFIDWCVERGHGKEGQNKP